MVWQGKFQRIYESFSCLTHMKILQNSKINMIFKNNKLIIIKYKSWHCFHHQIEKNKNKKKVFSLCFFAPSWRTTHFNSQVNSKSLSFFLFLQISLSFIFTLIFCFSFLFINVCNDCYLLTNFQRLSIIDVW